MKLRGIQDSKGRCEVWEKNTAKPAPQPAAAERQHSPQQLDDGTAKCCGRVYAKHALAVHLAGGAVHEWHSGIGTVREDMPPTVGDEMARARLYAEAARRERQGVAVADGADPTCYGW